MAKDKKLYYLVDHIVKLVHLPDFIEESTKCDLTWTKNHESALCNCPMPNHNDKNASFRINLLGEGIWVYHCFGCNVSGTIVHFCQDYYGLRNQYESILFLCKKLKIKDKEDLIIQGLKNVSKKVDLQRKMENANIMVSNQCRMLLHKDFKLHQEWVSKTYRRLNDALENENYEEIEKIGYEASSRMCELVTEAIGA